MKRWSWLALVLIGCKAAAPPPAARPAQPGPTGEVPMAATEDEGPLPIAADDPSWGSRTAPVTVIEFADFQCPYCARAEVTLAALKEEYGPKKLRVVWKNQPLPFHPHARALAELSQGVFELGGPDAFWTFAGRAMRGMDRLEDQPRLTQALVAGFTAGAVDTARLFDGLATGRWSAKVDRDARLAADADATGTPTFFVNGVRISGAQPAEAFREIIDEEARKASAKLEAGTRADRIHVEMAALNRAARAGDAVEEADEPPADPTADRTLFKIPLGKSPGVGPADALVTIVEFGDFECPFTRRAETTLQALRGRYPKELRVVWKHWPMSFHPGAASAAALTAEARAQKGDRGFWAAHAALLARAEPVTDTAIDALAGELGLNRARTKKAVEGGTHRAAIEADQELAEDFTVSGTPTFFINGRRVQGAQPEEVFVTIVEQELVRARAELANGTKANRLYEALTADGRGPAGLERITLEDAPGAPSRGSKKAPVTIVEFSDFQCPFCKRGDDTVTQLMQDFPGRVRRVFRHLPLSFHKHAQLAAEAAVEAQRQKGDEAFFRMHDGLFANQGDLEREGLERRAREVGLDMARFAAALDARTHKAFVEADARAAQAAGIRGTPAFSINGYLITGAQPYRKFKRLVQRALDEHAATKASAR